MTKLVKLTHAEHGTLKIANDCTVCAAENQHVIALRVNEVGQAAACFPILLNKGTETSEWSLSAMASFEPGSNLFIEDMRWLATHVPINMQTYPLFLMADEEEEKGYTVGIVPGDKAFTKEDDGHAIYNDDGELTDLTQRMVGVLEDDIKGSAQTKQFTQTLADLDLLKSTNLLVQYASGKVNRITGLYTIDEEKVRDLDTDTYLKLRENGYIIAIHAIMLSSYQLKGLIERHNSDSSRETVTQVQMDTSDKAES